MSSLLSLSVADVCQGCIALIVSLVFRSSGSIVDVDVEVATGIVSVTIIVYGPHTGSAGTKGLPFMVCMGRPQLEVPMAYVLISGNSVALRVVEAASAPESVIDIVGSSSATGAAYMVHIHTSTERIRKILRILGVGACFLGDDRGSNIYSVIQTDRELSMLFL